MFKATFIPTFLLLCVLGTEVFGQPVNIQTKKVGKGTVTELTPAVPPPVKGKEFVPAEAVGKVLDVELWSGSRKFVDSEGRLWKLVYGSPKGTDSDKLPGWHLSTNQNKQFFFTTDGRLFCFAGATDIEALRKKLGKGTEKIE